MNLLNFASTVPPMFSLSIAAVCLVMLGCFLLVAERVSPSVAWALIVAGGILYFGIRLSQRYRERQMEDEEDEDDGDE